MPGAWKMADGRKQTQAIAGTLRLYGNQAWKIFNFDLIEKIY